MALQASTVSKFQHRSIQNGNCVPLLLLPLLLSVVILIPSCEAQTERYIQIPVLKRVARLGFLYIEHTDEIRDIDVFRRAAPKEAITETQNPDQSVDTAITESFVDNFKLLNIDDNTAANILTGLTKPRGASSILKEAEQPFEMTGTLLHRHQTVVQSFQPFYDGLKSLFNEYILKHKEATHIVSSVTWGANVVVQVKLNPVTRKKLNVQQAKSDLKTELENIRKNVPSEGSESQFSYSVHSDIPVSNQMPATRQEVIDMLKEVPQLVQNINEGKGVPILVGLTPINIIRTHFQTTQQNSTAHKINEFSLNKIIHVFMDVSITEERISHVSKKLEVNSNCIQAEISTEISGLVDNFNKFKSNLTVNLKTALLNVRSGAQANTVLLDICEEYYGGPYNLPNINSQLQAFDSALEKIKFCNTLQTEFSEISYFGAESNLLEELLILQKSTDPVFVLFTNSEFTENVPGTYSRKFNVLMEKRNETGSKRLLVDCDFDHFSCSDFNQTTIVEYKNGTFIPTDSAFKLSLEKENLALQETIEELQNNITTLQNLTDEVKRTHEILVDSCAVSRPCLNGGTCLAGTNNTFNCSCLNEFSGTRCEVSVPVPPPCSPIEKSKRNSMKIIELDCGGLIEIPNLPSTSAYLVEYKKAARRTEKPQEHCLWTLNNIKDGKDAYLKVKVTLLCDGSTDSESSLSLLNWKWISSDWVLGSIDLSQRSLTYETNSSISLDYKLFLSYTSSNNFRSGFLALVEVTQATLNVHSSCLHYETSTGSQTFSPFAANHRFSIVVNPQQTQTNFTVNYLDSKDTKCVGYDTLDIFEIRQKNQPRRLDRLCGNVAIPRSYISTFPFLATFQPKLSTTGKGFQVSWK